MPEINKVQEGGKTIIKTKGVTLEEARKVLQKEQSARQVEVAKEVNKVLDKYGYAMQVEHRVVIAPVRR